MRRILAARNDFVLLAAISVAYQIAAKERPAIPGVGTAGGFTFMLEMKALE